VMCGALARCLCDEGVCDMLICAEMDSRHSDGSYGVRSDNPSDNGTRETDFDIPDPMN
jgi:hypothetical protein